MATSPQDGVRTPSLGLKFPQRKWTFENTQPAVAVAGFIRETIQTSGWQILMRKLQTITEGHAASLFHCPQNEVEEHRAYIKVVAALLTFAENAIKMGNEAATWLAKQQQKKTAAQGDG